MKSQGVTALGFLRLLQALRNFHDGANMTLREIEDNLAKALYGMTKTEAISRRVCVQCKQPIERREPYEQKPGSIYSYEGAREYNISGLCEYCWDKIFEEDEEDDENE